MPPGPGQPARHALDGPLGARRRHPRHAEPGQHRLQPLARLHPDVGPAGRVAVRPRRRSARRCSSSDARASRQIGAVGLVVSRCSGCSSGSSPTTTPATSRRRSTSGKIVPAPALHAAARRHVREDEPRRRSAARSSSSTSGSRTARRARRRRRALAAACEAAGRTRASSSSASTCRTCAARRSSSSSASTSTTRSSATAARSSAATASPAIPETFFVDRERLRGPAAHRRAGVARRPEQGHPQRAEARGHELRVGDVRLAACGRPLLARSPLAAPALASERASDAERGRGRGRLPARATRRSTSPTRPSRGR